MLNNISYLFSRCVAQYLEKHMAEYTLFKTFEKPDSQSSAVLKDALLRIGEVEASRTQFSNTSDSFSDLITLIEEEKSWMRQSYLRMCLYSSFKEHKFKTIDELVEHSDWIMKDLKLTVSFMHPFKSYVDLATARLLSMSVEEAQPGPDTFMTKEELAEFSSSFNQFIPKYTAAVKLAIDIGSSKHIFEPYSSKAIVLGFDMSKVALYLGTENQIKIVELDKLYRVQTHTDGSLRINKIIDKRNKKKKISEEEKKKMTLELRVSDQIECRLSLTKDEMPDLLCDLFP